MAEHPKEHVHQSIAKLMRDHHGHKSVDAAFVKEVHDAMFAGKKLDHPAFFKTRTLIRDAIECGALD